MKNTSSYTYIILFIFIGMLYSNMSLQLKAEVTDMSLTVHPTPSIITGGETFFPSHSEVHRFEASSGGTFNFENPDGSSVTIIFFSGTTQVALDFFIDAYEKSAVIGDRPLPTGKDVVGSLIYDMRTFVGAIQTATFDAPFAMIVHYTEEHIANLNEETVDIYFWDESQQTWTTFLDSTLDTAENTITILTDHLTLFATLGESEEAAAATVGGGGGIFAGGLMLRGDFRAVINNNDKITNSRLVILNFDVDPIVKTMMISNTKNFSGANKELYDEIRTWTLTEGEGVKTVYVKFYDILGVASEVVTDIIIFRPLSEAQRADVNKDNKVDIFDFNILMVNWGLTIAGNIADINNNGRVDIFDFNLLMTYWA